MMKTLLKGIILLLSFVCTSLKGQACNCYENYVKLKQNVEADYVGFSDKITVENEKSYQHFADSLKRLALESNSPKCYKLLTSYLNYFKDPHLNLSVNVSPDNEDKIRQLFIGEEIIDYDLSKLKNHFALSTIDPIEGIWEYKDKGLQVAIYKEPGEDFFKGVILKADSITWFPGQLKMKIKKDDEGYHVDYFGLDHTLAKAVEFQFAPGKLNLSTGGVWEQIFPIADTTMHAQTKLKPVIEFKIIDDSCSLLTIKSFNIKYKSEIDSVVGFNYNTIQKSKYLILDLRGNGGGHNATLDTIMPLLYTNPVLSYPFYIKSSPNNIELYSKALTNPNFPKETKNAFQKLIDTLLRHPKQMVKMNEGDTLSYDSVLPFPKKIALIVNKGSASLTEQLLFDAEQSTKAITFGANTAGALDYTEVGERRFLPCSYLYYLCPMGKTKRNRLIDNIGIKPNVVISNDVQDWVSFVKDYLEKL